MADPSADGRGATLVVMAKAPIPGFAKTRLIPRLGPDGAAELHAILLERTLRAAVTSGFDAVCLWCAPSRSARPFEALAAAASLDLRDQPGGDLGARMLAAFEAHLPAGPVVVIGTDCPELSAGHLAAARAALARGADAVLVPAEDGGYAAIGLARAHPSLFDDMRWGSPLVMAATRERIRRLGWAAHELSPLRDVDLPEDVDWLLSSGILGEEERARIEPYR
jgi:rSAM/selenodomain-associated transferase 1